MTLIFYEMDPYFWNEPFLNVVAAAAQFSTRTHVEVAIGEEAGASGQMKNVCRIFNDDVGVELASRTGCNPKYKYLALCCSKKSEQAMLAYARSLQGRPFNRLAMARSLYWPRRTTGNDFFCAELVASVLQRGGLIGNGYNPGSATPESLYQFFKPRAAATANPYTLRNLGARKQPVHLLNGIGPPTHQRDVHSSRNPSRNHRAPQEVQLITKYRPLQLKMVPR